MLKKDPLKPKDYNSAILNGPYLDAKNYKYPLCGMIALLILNETDFRGLSYLK